MKLSIVLVAVFFSLFINAGEQVTLQNFHQASTELAITKYLKQGVSLGKVFHKRALTPIDQQNIVRMNRDTLYSSVILDLKECEASITLPEIGDRLQIMQVVNQFHLSPFVAYKPGTYDLSQDAVGSRYAVVIFRTGHNPNLTGDIDAVHVAQDGIKVSQKCAGNASGLTQWDLASYKAVRDLLNKASNYLGDNNKRMGATWADVNLIQHMVGAASSWGLLPPSFAKYLITYPEKNDGNHPYQLTFAAPDLNYEAGGFWSITLYNADGFIPENSTGLYSYNQKTAVPNDDGSFTINFGGDPANTNYLPIEGLKDWNYSMRLYLPNEQILREDYKFPSPTLVK